MALQHCILHSIHRATETSPIEVKLRDEDNDGDGVLSLYEQLGQTYRRSALRQVGQFDPERSDNPFPGLLQDLKEEKTSLARVSQKLMDSLKHTLDGHNEPFRAHILFALENVMNQDVLSMFWIDHQEAIRINNDLALEFVEYIDTKHLLAGVSIHLSDYHESPDSTYLSYFNARGEKELGECIKDFCCFTTEVNTAADTEAFLNIVEQFTEQLPEDNAAPMRNEIVDYCIEQNMAGEPVHVDVLSNLINEREPEGFSNFVAERQEVPKKIIHTHRPSLKKFGRISARDKDISLSFSSNLIGEGIEFDAENNTLMIRHLPKGLKEQLRQSLEKHPHAEE